jgi:ActR/RegA family two-component response regulator
MSSRVMLVGMSKRQGTRLQKIFKSVQVECDLMAGFDNAFTKISTDPPALVLAAKPDDMSAVHSLNLVLSNSAPATPFLMMLPTLNSSTALEAMKAGAYDCLTFPADRFDVLAAAKRATTKKGRSLFLKKVVRRKSPVGAVFFFFLLLSMLTVGGVKMRHGAPPATISLGSANLSGLQWEGEKLWVGDWFESTVTRYQVKPAFFKRWRVLTTDSLYRMQDGQPILICNTPDAMVTVSADLKMRSHQWSVGLPTLQTYPAPSTNPTGLAWDGKFLWSTDGQTGFIYKHGVDFRVLESIKSLIPHPLGLAYENGVLWVLGGSPLRLAAVHMTEKGRVWKGPYLVPNLLSEGVVPSGMAVGYDRLWLASGGDPRMVSRDLKEITKQLSGWKNHGT